jgi:hypothetical protein
MWGSHSAKRRSTERSGGKKMGFYKLLWGSKIAFGRNLARFRLGNWRKSEVIYVSALKMARFRTKWQKKFAQVILFSYLCTRFCLPSQKVG